jgi:hypothetical protein
MSTFSMHVTIKEQIDKYRKNCLWRGSDENNRVNAKAAWTMVTRAKDEGGLGVVDLQTQNEALLIKNLYKFFNIINIPSVKLIWKKYYSNGKLPNHAKKGSFWWKDILKILDKFKGMALISVQNGASCLFWNDLWFGVVPKHAFPELYSFTKNPSMTLQAAKMNHSLTQTFHLPLSTKAYQQFVQLELTVNDFQPSNLNDTWSYIWGRQEFSCKMAYK